MDDFFFGFPDYLDYDSLSDFSDDSSLESSSPENSQSPSVVIVNSETGQGGITRGGIVWRNRSEDEGDDASQGSSSSSISVDSSNSGSSIIGTGSPLSLDTSPQPGDSRYYLRNRANRQGGSPGRNDNMSTVSISSDSETEFELSGSDNEVEDPVQVILGSPTDRQDLSQQNNTPENIPDANRSLHIPDTAAVVEPVGTPVRTSEKRKCSSPVSKRARLDDSQDSDSGVDAGCNICYDSYTAVGAHRPVCLKCGHIFGFSCVERWLKVSCASGNKRCPTCNKKAHVKDIRYLYCCNLRAVDNTRVHQLSTELEQEKIQNSKQKVEITSFRIKLESLEKELTRYQALERAGLLQSKDSGRGVEQSARVPVFFSTISLCAGNAGTLGMARSLIYDEYKKLLLATHQNETRIFCGFGYSLFSLVNVVRSAPAHKFCHVSQKAIRDAAFHPQDSDLLLIVSLDKTAKLIDVRTGTRIQTYNTEYPLWSCAWDMNNPNLFLVGGVNGQLVRFDKRQTSQNGQTSITTWGTNVGVVSIIGIKPGPGRGLPRGGFLVCKLNAVLALETAGQDSSAEDVIKVLDTSGPFMSMSYLTSRNQVLLSSRPTQFFNNIRHRVFSLDQSPDGNPVLSLIQTIQGGSLAPSLSRSYIWPDQVQGHTLVYAYDASSKCLCGWSVSDTVKKVSLPCQEPVLDICRVEAEGEPMLAALSDSALHLYKHP